MGVPKNKITSAQRGKRRQGNKPKITKDTNQASVPLHKRAMVAEFLQLMGIASAKQTIARKPREDKEDSDGDDKEDEESNDK